MKSSEKMAIIICASLLWIGCNRKQPTTPPASQESNSPTIASITNQPPPMMMPTQESPSKLSEIVPNNPPATPQVPTIR